MPMNTKPPDAWLENFLGYPLGLLDHIYFTPMDTPINPSTEPLLPDDIWKKFELDFPEFTAISDLFDESLSSLDPSTYSHRPDRVCHIRHHDCMWAGHCASKEHPADEPRPGTSGITRLIPQPPVLEFPQLTMKLSSNPKSLLKPAAFRAAASQQQLLHIPQTPPMSDDEEVKVKQPTTVLQMLNQAINECDLDDDDSDLCEYFDEDVDVEDEVAQQPTEDDEAEAEEEEEEDVDEEEEEMKKRNIRLKFAAESDHSYHKGKHPSMSVQSLGIDTPSDSEEEIDVVSVAEKFQQAANNTGRSSVSGLPNRPSNRDRHHIQRRVATAIHKNRNTGTINNTNEVYGIACASTSAGTISYGSSSSTSINASSPLATSSGIKTILPVRKPSNQECKKQQGGVKRQKQHSKQNSNAYKRKHYSSDSEPEPSEKRSLHNNMERKRRVDLRNAFEDLRRLVPEVCRKERAAKVVILREAAKYCHQLTNNSTSQEKEAEELKRQQKWLRNRVSQLRRALAYKR